ncbi:MAG: hypothetical protein A2Z01_03740 [Betaproteobacteria bacterium RBG_16_58_11]|nr:MAG: hypothetical protein A2Z01_03740 [Betaproteobacteria bacterium RBG_16_58_11]
MKATMSANQMQSGTIVWRWFCSRMVAVLSMAKKEQQAGAGMQGGKWSLTLFLLFLMRKSKVALQDVTPSAGDPFCCARVFVLL